MQGFWWKLPVLRGLSPMRRGMLTAAGPVALVALLSFWSVRQSASEPSSDLCSTLAQIGATLVVAFAVETGGLVRDLGRRGKNPETLIGFLSGIGICGVVGIGVAWALSQHSGKLLAIETIGFSWAIGSIALLGGLVAAMPLLMYEWHHAISTEYSDE